MDLIRVGDIELCTERLGDPADPPVLLIGGLAGQLISWDDGFCALLVERGLSVVRFDNRDAGLSTSLDGAPGFDRDVARRRDLSAAAYTLDDMAADAAGLLGALGIPAAHVVGVSMGGMIAQTLAIAHPERVLSLCSIMSTTGAPYVGVPTAAALGQLLRKPARDRQAYLDGELAAHAVFGSPSYPTPDEEVLARAARKYDRSYRPAGAGRQMMAVLMAEDRTVALGTLALPTLVVHGGSDHLVSPTGGAATVRAIPGATLLTIPGMGHELPPPVWPQLVEAIVANIGRDSDLRGHTP